MRGFAGLVAAVLLAGCATGVPVENEVIVTGQNFANVQGEARLVVRTFVEEADGPHEVLGASCQMVSSLFSATVSTPARLVVPNFGPQSPELVFECRAGELSGGARRKIVTTWQYPPGALAPGWGPGIGGPWGGVGWGAGWGGGWWAPPAIPVSRYPNVDVLLR